MRRIKVNDREFAAQLENFLSTVNPGLLAQAGVSSAEMAAVTSGAGSFQASLDQVQLARAAFRSAVEGKDADKQEVASDFQVVIEKFYATPSISDADLTSLGLPPRPQPVRRARPNAVTELRGQPNANGTARLRWNRAGNPLTTIFLVEASTAGGPWEQIAQTLRTSFVDLDAVPGVPKSYRVVASNSRGQSTPSTAVTFYPAAGSASNWAVAA